MTRKWEEAPCLREASRRWATPKALDSDVSQLTFTECLGQIYRTQTRTASMIILARRQFYHRQAFHVVTHANVTDAGKGKRVSRAVVSIITTANFLVISLPQIFFFFKCLSHVCWLNNWNKEGGAAKRSFLEPGVDRGIGRPVSAKRRVRAQSNIDFCASSSSNESLTSSSKRSQRKKKSPQLINIRRGSSPICDVILTIQVNCFPSFALFYQPWEIIIRYLCCFPIDRPLHL